MIHTKLTNSFPNLKLVISIKAFFNQFNLFLTFERDFYDSSKPFILELVLLFFFQVIIARKKANSTTFAETSDDCFHFCPNNSLTSIFNHRLARFPYIIFKFQV